VFTVRLADALRRAGHEPIVQWLDLRYELAPWLLRRLPAPAGVDIIHAGSIQAFALKRPGIPLVVTEHQYLRHPAFRSYSRGLRKLYHWALLFRYMERSYVAADAIVAVSEHCAVAMRAELRLPVEVIHHWLDLEAFRPEAKSSEREPLRLLFVGNPSPWKGADVLPKLATRLGDAVRITAMGGLRKPFVTESDSPSNLESAPSRPTSDMPHAYADVDATLVVSRYESFGYVALESMACGRPVIGFDAPGTNEVCVDGETGRLVPIDDIDALARHCLALAADRDTLKRWGDSARQRAERYFSEARGASEYIAVYNRLLARA
jgi:glycosyltransferase involved in cell wall biosynthesis